MGLDTLRLLFTLLTSGENFMCAQPEAGTLLLASPTMEAARLGVTTTVFYPHLGMFPSVLDHKNDSTACLLHQYLPAFKCITFWDLLTKADLP